MSTEKTWQTESTSSDATEKLAERLGRNLRGGEVIELVSDLGGGKTTFVRGLARGMNSPDNVSSPSYTISQVYQAGNLELHHYDFYRLEQAGLMTHELGDDLENPHAVVVIEWADVVQHVLPASRIRIHIKSTGDETRQLDFRYPASLGYAMDGIC